jgi:hypothetical protein
MPCAYIVSGGSGEPTVNAYIEEHLDLSGTEDVSVPSTIFEQHHTHEKTPASPGISKWSSAGYLPDEVAELGRVVKVLDEVDIDCDSA